MRGVHSEHRACNPRCGWCHDREGSGPKDFGTNTRDACFPKCFQAPKNVVKYDSKTNTSVWLEDYRHTCRVGMADYNLFII
jgi:hypothetical protein